MSQTIITAIQNRSVISFYYKGKLRTAEPHLLGYDTRNHLTLSAWQLSGGSGVSFRDFHVSDMSGITTTGQTFSGARAGYNPSDRTMPRILARL